MCRNNINSQTMKVLTTMLSYLKFKLTEKVDNQTEQNQPELKIRCGHQVMTLV